jgi:acetyl-CoA carboxylase carboxyltransferase component
MSRHPSSQWGPELAELESRQQSARAMGGSTAVAKAKTMGKLTARERVVHLVDPDSARELGMLAGKGHYDEHGDLKSFTPSNHVLCLAKVSGQRVVVVADDFTIRGGSSEAAVAEKWIYADRYAYEYKLPLIRMVDTAGGSVKLLQQTGHTKIPGYALWPSTALLGLVPVVGIAMGPCAGLGAIRVSTSHLSIMVRGKSQVFAAGPPVVKRALGVDIDKETLGGYDVHKLSGTVNNPADTEDDALAMARRFLSYLPENVWTQPPRSECADSPSREEAWLNDAIPRDRRKVFNSRKILTAIFDAESIFEISPDFGASLLTCLGRLNGYPVGVMINNAMVMGGALTVAAARKMERFVDLCDTFHLPVVNLVDQPGTMTGIEAERNGTIAAVLRASAAIEQCSVPWVAVILRRCFGLAGGMISPWSGASGIAIPHRFAWPSARWGSIPIEGGVAAAYKTEIDASTDPDALVAALESQYHAIASPFRTAERFSVVDIIEPATTRVLLCDWVEDAYRHTARTMGPKGRTMR